MLVDRSETGSPDLLETFGSHHTIEEGKTLGGDTLVKTS
jgi:hypothetical protein